MSIKQVCVNEYSPSPFLSDRRCWKHVASLKSTVALTYTRRNYNKCTLPWLLGESRRGFKVFARHVRCIHSCTCVVPNERRVLAIVWRDTYHPFVSRKIKVDLASAHKLAFSCTTRSYVRENGRTIRLEFACLKSRVFSDNQEGETTKQAKTKRVATGTFDARGFLRLRTLLSRAVGRFCVSRFFCTLAWYTPETTHINVFALTSTQSKALEEVRGVSLSSSSTTTKTATTKGRVYCRLKTRWHLAGGSCLFIYRKALYHGV